MSAAPLTLLEALAYDLLADLVEARCARLVAAAVAVERERCARLAQPDGSESLDAVRVALARVAAAIRTRQG